MSVELTTRPVASEVDEPPPITIRRRRRDDDEMDITPMIDIVFLLLIFFIVCSTMDPTKMGKIPEAQNGLAVAGQDSAVIFINPGAGDAVIQLLSRGSCGRVICGRFCGLAGRGGDVI